MRTARFALVTAVALAFAAPAARAGGAAAPGAAAPGDSPNWRLTWSDEFEGPNGSGVDRTKWVPETGGGGWGNNELEYYRDSPENAFLEDGCLVIKAIKGKYTGPDGVSRDYTSARLKTQGKFSQAYGRFEVRMKIGFGQGIWPAFWLLGDDVSSAGWPQCGEVDIMENIGREPTTVHGTIHGPGYSGASGPSSSYSLPSSARFADDYHVYAIEWEPKAIRWYVDDALYATKTPADIPRGSKWVYDHPFFVILNMAVGGGWPGNPDATTTFPQTTLVDYVRVYARAGATIASCEPQSAQRGATADLTLTGTGFQSGATVTLADKKIKVVSANVVSDTQMTVRVKIKKKAAAGPRDVTVTNPDGGSGVGTGVFSVQ